jgi:Vacuolar sorting-associated protein 13, N-terminal/Repeating coiled region of VPS13
LASGLDNPTVQVFPRLSDIQANLDEEQYKTLLQSVDWFAQTQVLKSNLKYRPHRRISDGESPKSWWNYAITAIRQVIADREAQYTWSYIYRRKETKTAYMRLFAKRELKIATPVETQTLLSMEKELSVVDIKWFRTVTRRYLQMLRHEEEKEDDSKVKKDAWELIRQHLGDFATKDLDTAPSSGGWLSMLSWGGSSAKKEDPRWEESAEEVGYVLGWQNIDEEVESSVDSRVLAAPTSRDISSDYVSPSDQKPVQTNNQASSEVSRPSTESSKDKKVVLPQAPQSYQTVAAKPFSFGIEHIAPHPSNADVFLLIDVRLLKGSLTLRRGPHQGANSNKPLAAITFTGFRPIFRIFTSPTEPNSPPTWEFTSKLSKLIVIDESNPLSKFKKIVQAPRPAADGSASIVDLNDTGPIDFDDPELWNNPLLVLNAAQLSPKTGYNLRVDIRLEESLIFYHRRFVEEIVRFFRPPDKHETLNALFDAMMEATKEYATETMDSLRTAEAPITRSALEFAITETRANIIQLDLKAPLIIFPEKYNPR